ncbi:MAG: cupredoxin domain-containing protein [Gammaproteobacteria bacterium]|nr:cupredoxin domain-containing protein [Gammaproteobacteria bacterium]
MHSRLLTALLTATLGAGTSLALANDAYTLTIKDHRFEPAELTIPADTRVKVTVKNLDPTPEEFESYELNREKIIAGGKEAIVYIGPVQAGRYPFFGEFNQDTAKGVIIAE